MTIDFRCDDCGRQLRAEDHLQGAEALCPSCNASTVVPIPLEVAEPVNNAQTSAPAPVRTETDDGITPGRAACPKCGAGMGPGVVLCIECGFDTRTGQQRKTKARRLRRTFDRSLSLGYRVAMSLAAVLCPALFMATEQVFVWWLLPPSLFVAATIVTPYGYIFRISVRRNRRGDLLLKKEHWVCCLPLANWTINLRGYAQAWTDYSANVREDQYHDHHASERFVLEIAGPKQRTRVIYSGPDEEFMLELADLLHYDAGLQIKRK
jgi:hypothetical protein